MADRVQSTDTERLDWLSKRFQTEPPDWLEVDWYWMSLHVQRGRDLRQAVDHEIAQEKFDAS